MITRRTFTCGLAALLTGANLPARGQSAPLRIVVGFAPGGAADVVARALADSMRVTLGRPVLVDNRAGASGAIAAQAVATAEPDGNTLLLSPSSNLTLRPFVESSLRIDAERQLAPVGAACEVSFALAVGSATPATTLTEFVAWCKAHPNQASFGSPGSGTPMHVIGSLFAQEARITLEHVPYRGGAQAMSDLLGGQLPSVVSTIPLVVALHRAGRIRILASTAARRIESVATVPTFAEEGYPVLRFDEVFGLFAPPRTPAETIEVFSKALRTALEHEATRSALTKVEFTPRFASASEFGATVKADVARWRNITPRLGLKPQQ